MRQVRLKAVAPPELLRQRLQHIQLQLSVNAAPTAHHVVMPRGVRSLVLRHAIVKMGVPHDAQLFEHFERAVDGRDVDIRKDADDLLIHLVDRDVSVHRGDGVEDQLSLWRHPQSALSERDFQLARRDRFIHSRAAPYHSSMSTSGSEDTASEQPEHGEILKASSPGPEQIQVGMQVTSLDGERLGEVKEVREGEFLLDRPMSRDLWVPFSAVLATSDYTGNIRGPVQPDAVVLEVAHARVDEMGWRHS